MSATTSPSSCARSSPLADDSDDLRRSRCDDWRVQRYLVTIQGAGWEDLQDVELPREPEDGDAIETRYGTCLVTTVEPSPDADTYAGKIVCRLP